MYLPSWILHQTSHNGNVGSAARAIKTMGFSDLILVDPKDPLTTSSEEAIALASGANDVLGSAQVISSLANACGPFSLVFGLTSRSREFGPPAISLEDACHLAKEALKQEQKVAFLFGTERTGLANEDLEVCSHRVWIDANPEYPSLNLAQAIMVCAYEMRKTLQLPVLDVFAPPPKRATQEAIAAAMTHWKEGLEAIAYLDPAHPKKLMERFRALFDRAGLQEEEIDLLRGIAKQMIAHKK